MDNPFVKYKKNITSQWGEDGIIEEIFNRIGDGSKFCIEFGAWDGIEFSNTWNLWNNRGWGALLIESNTDRTNKLKEKISLFPEVVAYNAFVTSTGEDSLDAIIEKVYESPRNIDLLSIDIDGNDYYIWQNLSARPRVVIVEHNLTIPPIFDIVQKSGAYFGASAAALVRLGKEKGYSLVACTETNCIFILEQEFPKLDIPTQLLENIFIDSYIRYLISDYGGSLYATGKNVYSPTKTKNETIPTGDIPLTGMRTNNQTGIESKLIELKKKIRRIIPTSLIQVGYGEISYLQWLFRGRPVPPPHRVKINTIRAYARRFNLDTFIETGTFLGDTIYAVQKLFKKIISIEIEGELYQQALERFKGKSHIELIQGDSGIVMESVLSTLHKPVLFWLDGHYSGTGTGKGDGNTPVLRELEAILSSHVKHVILIDDARCFTGNDGYPTISDLKKKVLKKNNDLLFEVKDDIIRIIPRTYDHIEKNLPQT